MKVHCALDCKNTIGESCFWDSRDKSLWWTDIEGKCAYRLDEYGMDTRFELPDRAGFILPRVDPGFIIGFSDRVVIADPLLREFTNLHSVEANIPHTRINDAKVDPFGGIVFGTYNESQDKERKPVASVYRLSPEGSLSRLFGGVTVSNGLAFSLDSTRMYFADTAVAVVRQFLLGPNFESFEETNPLAGADVAPGKPDGATVDSQDHYWSARVWGSCIARIDPEGTVVDIIEVPVKGPTCVALGGSNLDELFITTLRTRHSDSDLAEFPLAGGLFKVRVDTPGIPQVACSV